MDSHGSYCSSSPASVKALLVFDTEAPQTTLVADEVLLLAPQTTLKAFRRIVVPGY